MLHKKIFSIRQLKIMDKNMQREFNNNMSNLMKQESKYGCKIRQNSLFRIVLHAIILKERKNKKRNNDFI
jgi:hypothetical protein